MKIKKLLASAVTALLIGVGLSLVATAPASATGSDSSTPYSVTADGITLPAGTTFQDNGHVNIKTNQGDRGIHFEALNNQPSGQWIGKSFLPWSAFGLDPATICVSWVQVAEYNEHFGEGGQAPVGKGCQPSQPETPKKVAVCKYVGTPGVDERLQTGQNPIEVSVNALKDFPGTFPWQFADQHGRSIALGWAPGNYTLADCPEPEKPTQPEALTGTETREGSPVCVEPKDGTAKIVFEARDWTQAYVWTNGAWVLGDKVFGDWTVTDTKIVEAKDCTPPPPAPASPKASIEKTCGEATITLSNGVREGLTASFVVEVDGEFYGAYSVAAGEPSKVVELTFPEDTGTHTVEVFQAGTSEWKSIAKADVESDCIPPVVTPPTEEPPVVVPPVVEPPVVVPPVATVVTPTAAKLPATGGDFAMVAWLTGASLLVALGGLATVLGYRRRRANSES